MEDDYDWDMHYNSPVAVASESEESTSNTSQSKEVTELNLRPGKNGIELMVKDTVAELPPGILSQCVLFAIAILTVI